MLVRSLFRIMRTKSKPIGKRSIVSVLGSVGRDSFLRIQKEKGWRNLNYTMREQRFELVLDRAIELTRANLPLNTIQSVE